MKSIVITVVGAAVLWNALARSAPSTVKMTALQTDESQVLDVIEGFNNAFAANDPEKYFTYIDPEITVITPTNPYRVEGIVDDRAEFEHGLRMGTSRVGYFQEMQRKVQMLGNSAVVTYFSRGSYGREGQEKVCYFKETDVLTRREDGWKIVHIHVSATP